MTLAFQDNPEQLYPANGLEADITEKVWRIAKVKSRREKSLARFLAGQGIGYYLPMLSRPQSSQKRIRLSLLPVFSGYLFFMASDQERHIAFRSNHIARVIEVQDQSRLIRELRQIRQVLSLDTQVYPYHFISKGQQVRMVRGPLKGLEGIVVKKASRYRLVLSVSELMQSVLVEIDSEQVEPVLGQGRQLFRDAGQSTV